MLNKIKQIVMNYGKRVLFISMNSGILIFLFMTGKINQLDMISKCILITINVLAIIFNILAIISTNLENKMNRGNDKNDKR